MKKPSAIDKILALFKACGKETPKPDTDMYKAVEILATICESQPHTIPDVSGLYDGMPLSELHERHPEHEVLSDIEDQCMDIFEALEGLESKIGEDDFNFEFDGNGNEYRIISENAIWDTYVEEIKNIVISCYDLKLDNIPDFIAVEIDWEQTAKNAYSDGYGHTFSGYDGSEEEAGGYYIFRHN